VYQANAAAGSDLDGELKANQEQIKVKKEKKEGEPAKKKRKH
jgi:hypothetical protein